MPTVSADFESELTTADGSVYPIGPDAIACQPFVELDVQATNGVIHIIDGKPAEITPL